MSDPANNSFTYFVINPHLSAIEIDRYGFEEIKEKVEALKLIGAEFELKFHSSKRYGYLRIGKSETFLGNGSSRSRGVQLGYRMGESILGHYELIAFFYTTTGAPHFNLRTPWRFARKWT
jgi:hypothetical protein